MAGAPSEVPSSSFNLVFVCVLLLTLISLAACFYSTFWLSNRRQAGVPASNLDEVQKLAEVLRYVFSLGCGAVFGLIGGRGIK
jgi:hypothetical protein